MEVSVERVKEAFRKFYEACRVIVKFVCQVWERIKKLAWVYMKNKKKRTPRPLYGYVKHRAMKSQVLNRKPMLIRARTTC